MEDVVAGFNALHQHDSPAAAPSAGLVDPGRPWAVGLELAGDELLSWRRSQLRRGGRPDDLDWLLDLVAGVDWAGLQRLRLDPRRRVPSRATLAQLASLWECHLQTSQPLQYLAGACPWRDLTLAVAPGVLIPRPETELLVDLAQDHWLEARPPLWADLGTGSACLAVALARLWPDSEGFAVDCSPQALRQAGRNLRQHGVEHMVQLLPGSWWQPLRPWWGGLDLVVANPPYIPTAVWAELDSGVRDHEPRRALDGGADGLLCLRAIAASAAEALAPGGWLLLEHHHDQSDAVVQLLLESGLDPVQPHCDLEGTRRFVVARHC